MVEEEAVEEEKQNGEDVSSSSPPILHVVVVGFHHKKGCQVEFAHPPLMPGTYRLFIRPMNISSGGGVNSL